MATVPAPPAGDRLVPNMRSEAARAVVSIGDDRVRGGAITGLHLIARLTAGHSLGPRQNAALSESLRALIEGASGGKPA